MQKSNLIICCPVDQMLSPSWFVAQLTGDRVVYPALVIYQLLENTWQAYVGRTGKHLCPPPNKIYYK